MTAPARPGRERLGASRVAALHQVGNYLRHKGCDASSFGKAARDPKRSSRYRRTLDESEFAQLHSMRRPLLVICFHSLRIRNAFRRLHGMSRPTEIRAFQEWAPIREQNHATQVAQVSVHEGYLNY